MPEVDKIITQRAQGYGSTPTNVTVQINGIVMLQGPVPTLDQPPPTLPDDWTAGLGANAWTWRVANTFNGTQTMTVEVLNGQLDLYDTVYVLSSQKQDEYALRYTQQQGNLTFSDPLTSVSINGVAQDPVRDQTHDGQWVWQLKSGDQFTATVNIVNPIT